LTNTLPLSQYVTDAGSFWSALRANALDECLARVRQPEADEDQEACLNCRLAEALMQAGRYEEAVECCRRAFPDAQTDAALLQICAWVFSKASRFSAALGII
jgi:Flp pilus assembly protein TadD